MAKKIKSKQTTLVGLIPLRKEGSQETQTYDRGTETSSGRTSRKSKRAVLQKILTMANLVFMRVYETCQMMHLSIQRK